jgi:hypothetical protein
MVSWVSIIHAVSCQVGDFEETQDSYVFKRCEKTPCMLFFNNAIRHTISLSEINYQLKE